MLCMSMIFIAGCGDKFAKEKEAILKREQAAMAMPLPVLVKPDYFKASYPSRQEVEKYWQDFKTLIETEKKILAEMRKSDGSDPPVCNAHRAPPRRHRVKHWPVRGQGGLPVLRR